jgi:peptidoglycan lytic transglycosylase
MKKEGAMIGRMALFVIIVILACQLSPSCLTRASAADQNGVASVYSTESGSRTAGRQKLNLETLTAAHRTLPFGTKVKVTNKSNGHSVVVIINDRGPFVRGRIIDLSPAAARVLGFSGLTQVRVTPRDMPVRANAVE